MLVHLRRECAAIEVVEAAYVESRSIDTWLERVVDVACPAFAADLGLIATVMRRAPERVGIEAYAERDNPFGWVRGLFEQACRDVPAHYFEPYYGVGPPVRSLDEIQQVIRASGHDVDVGARFVEMGGLADLRLMVGHPTHDTVLSIAALDRGTGPAARLDRRRLTQLVLHLENAARLHLVSHEELAILTPDGRIEHVDTQRTTSSDRAELGGRVQAIERIRTGAHDEGLDAWPALVNGVYSLMERTDHDGKRYYVAFENPHASRAHRTLSGREQRVIELTARGLSGKWTAYSLGLSEATVSEALASAATKLGVSSRTSLVAVASELIGRPCEQAGAESPFTESEREVLALVRTGMSNEAIASARGRSVRTIANQVASLLRKTGAGSRRALAALPATTQAD